MTKIQLQYVIECDDEIVAGLVIKHVHLDEIVSIDGVTMVKSVWLADKEQP